MRRDGRGTVHKLFSDRGQALSDRDAEITSGLVARPGLGTIDDVAAQR